MAERGNPLGGVPWLKRLRITVISWEEVYISAVGCGMEYNIQGGCYVGGRGGMLVEFGEERVCGPEQEQSQRGACHAQGCEESGISKTRVKKTYLGV